MRRTAICALSLALLLLAGCAKAEDTQWTAVPGAAGGDTKDSVPPRVTKTLPIPTEETMARALLAEMTTEERVGQLFLARFPTAGWEEDAAEYHLGGYLFFSRDFELRTPDGFRAMLAQLQEGADIPLLLGVDEEGGGVVRASYHPQFRSTPFQSPQALYRRGGMDALAADAAEKSAFLLDLGLNLNLAPVCDVSANRNDYIYSRTLGRGGEETAQYVALVVGEMKAVGIGAALKHFPGYGGSSDTHTGMAVDSRPLEALEESDLLPFQAGIDAGAGAVLVSHNIVTALDGERPASLSPAVYQYLRDMGFTGVAVTDDLVMEAVRREYGVGPAAVLAVQAGCDLLCSSEYREQYRAVLEAAKGGTISPERLEEAALRVLRWKISLGLMESQT